MYKLQENPDQTVMLENGGLHNPVATLRDEYGGVAHIAEDDHCHVLILGNADRPFRVCSHWFPEAVNALKQLPTPVPA